MRRGAGLPSGGGGLTGGVHIHQFGGGGNLGEGEEVPVGPDDGAAAGVPAEGHELGVEGLGKDHRVALFPLEGQGVDAVRRLLKGI